MTDREGRIPEEVAKSYKGRHLWNVSKRGVLWVGQKSAEDSEAEVRDFEIVAPLLDFTSISSTYNQRLAMWFEPAGRLARLVILRQVVDEAVDAEILGADREDPVKLDKAKRVKNNMAVVFGNLSRKTLHPNSKTSDPFVADHTKGNKVEVEIKGQKKMVEVKSACPAIQIATELYWDFEKIIDPSSPGNSIQR